MRRRPLLAALLLSLLMHAGIVLLVLRTYRPQAVEPAPRQVPLDVEFVQIAPAAPAPEIAAKPKPLPAAPRKERIARAEPTEPPRELAPQQGDGPSNSADAPGKLKLVPENPFLSEAQAPTEGSKGVTLYPDDPALSGWAQREEEEFRVKNRVDGWLEDAAAEGRAQRGLPHPYLAEVGEAVRGGLDATDGGTPNALGGPNAAAFLFNRYRGAAEQYARTGNPGLSPPGLAPRQTERQRELLQKETHITDSEGKRVRTLPWLQAFTQSAETLQELAHNAPLLSLTLELRQAPDGSVVDQKLLERSQSAKFDAFVLRVVPEALAGLGPVPEDALRGRPELRSVWLIEGWPRLPKELDEAMTMFGAPAVMGVPADVVMLQRAASEQFRFRARLLRAY